jgi:DUF4097 and DUF4098 domain-containing protein YvlB
MKKFFSNHFQMLPRNSAPRYITLILTIFPFAFPAVVPTLRAEITEKSESNFILVAGGSITLENLNGSARFAASSGTNGEVHVQAIKHGATEADLKTTEIEVKSEPAALHIRTHYGKGDWLHGNNASVEYVVTVPAGFRLQSVHLTNGDLTLDGLTLAAVRANCTNGRLTVRDLNSTGSIKLENVNGKMDVSLLSLPSAEPVDISDVNGEIHLTIPSGANATVRASTVNGGIKTNTGLKSKEESFTGQKLEGRLGAGTTPVRLETTNGSIQFEQVPAR